MYPGQTTYRGICGCCRTQFGAVVEHNFGTVAGSVFTQFASIKNIPQLEEGQTLFKLFSNNHCNKLQHTILTKRELVLTGVAAVGVALNGEPVFLVGAEQE